MTLLGAAVFAAGLLTAVLAATSGPRIAGLATMGAGAVLALLSAAPERGAALAVVVLTSLPLAVVTAFALYLARRLRRATGERTLTDELETR